MASSPLTPGAIAFDLTTVYQPIYTVPATAIRAGIDAAVFNNYSSSKVTYSVRIVQGGVATVLNEVITDKTIRATSNDLAPAIIGQAITKGGTLEAKASVDSSVSATVTVTTIDETS